MGVFERLERARGGYIFLSHSHDDIIDVRKIRNLLEREGFEPLCFYLKCLKDDGEVEDLIKREIDAREWFVFIDSDNSRKSRWVTLERRYINRTNKKKIIELDIDADESEIVEIINRITHNLKIYFSYSTVDKALAQRIKDKLEDKDYLVYSPFDSVVAGTDYHHEIVSAIVEASQDGCVIALITPDSLKKMHILNEISIAFSEGGNIIPIVVGDVELDSAFKYYLCRKRCYYLSENPTDEEIGNVIEHISESALSRIKEK